MAVIVSYVTTRRSMVGYRALGFLATAPIAIPGIVLGVGLFLGYTRLPSVLGYLCSFLPEWLGQSACNTFAASTQLYGTIWILLIAFVTLSLPAAYQQMQSAFHTVHVDLEEASRILGATRLRSLYDITAPLLRTSVIATWCFIFVGVMRELSAAVILFTSDTKVLSVLIFDLKESGDLGAIAVIGLAMLLITFAVVIAASRIPGFSGVRLRNS
jgi:iron(III) transport system permease protein